jgi:chromosome segregation ATPase
MKAKSPVLPSAPGSPAFAARIAELEKRIAVLEDENERLVESEAQTSRELASVMHKWEDSERRAAQFAAMETSYDASVAAAEQHAEDVEEALEVSSSVSLSWCQLLVAVTSKGRCRQL